MRVWSGFYIGLMVVLSWGGVAAASKIKVEKNDAPPPPDLLLEGGRKLAFVRTFQDDHDVEPKRGFFKKVVDVVAGPPQRRQAIRPYSIAVDSRGRAIVTDPGAMGIHIFDFPDHKYKFISRRDKDANSLRSPQCVAVDAQDNFYVTDSEMGKIFVFDSSGKFKRMIGSLKGGEGYFKRPTGIAVDSVEQRIYVTDTLRNKVYVLDMQGQVVQTIGQAGTQPGEFNYPTEVVLHGQDVAVVDAMNFRVQVFNRSGGFEYAVGAVGDGVGSFFRPKGSASIARATFTWSMAPGTSCRSSISKANCFTISAPKVRSPERLICLLVCLSITTTRSTWWIRTTAGCRNFNITENGIRPGATRNEVLVNTRDSSGTERRGSGADAGRCSGNARSVSQRKVSYQGWGLASMPVLPRAARRTGQRTVVGTNIFNSDIHVVPEHYNFNSDPATAPSGGP